MLRDWAQPGFFARHGTLVRRNGSTAALMLAEVGAEDHCILTRSPDAELVAEALGWLVDHHEGDRLVLYPSDEAAWLHEILGPRGFERGEVAGLEWGYGLSQEGEVPQPPEGFAIDALAGEGDYPAIDRCLEGAFGGDKNRVPILESLATNPMFRPELNILARGPEGRIAACCRGTVDADSGVCGIDPVATHPDYQGRGIGRAIVQACFAAQRSLGGRESYIGSAPEGSAGSYLYRSLNPVSKRSYSEWSRRHSR